MGDKKYRLLRGRAVAHAFSPVTQGQNRASPQRPDPATHRERLLAQLDAVAAEVAARGQRDAEATREIIAVRAADPKAPLKLEQLGNRAEDVRVIGSDPATGTVLLDAPDAKLEGLRAKAAEYGEEKQRKQKDGTVKTALAHVPALGPVAEIVLAAEQDLVGERLRAWSESGRLPSTDTKLWFEVACRGGYRNERLWSAQSRMQINRQVLLLEGQLPEEFEEPEELVFFVRLSLNDLRLLAGRVDCIIGYDVVPNEILNWLMLKDPPKREIREFKLMPPPREAPAVVLLDTGIATEHPLLKAAILDACSVVPTLESSPEDVHGHGTKMAGVALYTDLGRALEERRYPAPHWLHSVRLIAKPGVGISAEENRPFWPKLTVAGVAEVESRDRVTRQRAYALAVTFRVDPLLPTLWAQAINQLAHNDGHGRLFCVSAGNVRDEDVYSIANAYPDSLFQNKIHEPAQAVNALTVGAYTERTRLPPDADYSEAKAVAPAGGAAPHTTTGPPGKDWAIKPDIVLEGGNVALSDQIADPGAETLTTLTTGHLHIANPLAHVCMTSEAAARAARMAVDVWGADGTLRPETVRGLLVHSASWTPAMEQQFRQPDLFRACGYGAPDLEFARACAEDRATVIIEDSMPNAVEVEQPRKRRPKKATTPGTELVRKRQMKVFRMPAHEDLLLVEPERDVELRVTLSYFPEPSKFRSRIEHGLDLRWDMQGPQEKDDKFLERVNAVLRPRGPGGKRIKTKYGKSFKWEIGKLLRGRGTVQSDRWVGKASMLAGAKLIAVYPVLGWWDRRDDMQTKSMPFSLIVTIVAPGIFTAVQAELAAVVTIETGSTE